jgi:thiol-disulfide isomerase/thioredoxin
MNQAKFLLMLASTAVQLSLPMSHPAFAQPLAQGDPSTIGKTFLTSEHGRRVQISDFRGKVVFINFWGNWCPPCVDEMHSVGDLQVALKDRRDAVAFIFISAKPQAFQEDIEWLKRHGIVGEDYQWGPRFPEQRYAFFGALPDQATFSVPTTYVLDRNGAVAEFATTPVDWKTHLDMFLNLLSGRPAEPYKLY